MLDDINKIFKDERYEELLAFISDKLAMLWLDYQILNHLVQEKVIKPDEKPLVKKVIKQVRKLEAEKKTSKEEKNRDSVAFWESVIRNPDSTVKEKRLARTNLDRLINQDNIEHPEDPETYAVKIRQLINDGLACTGASKLHFTDDGFFDPILNEAGEMLPCPTQEQRDERDKKRAEAYFAKHSVD